MYSISQKILYDIAEMHFYVSFKSKFCLLRYFYPDKVGYIIVDSNHL